MSNYDSSRLVTGLFNDRESAERAYQHAAARGYTKDDVNLVLSEEARKRPAAHPDILSTSSETGLGMAELRAAVIEALG